MNGYDFYNSQQLIPQMPQVEAQAAPLQYGLGMGQGIGQSGQMGGSGMPASLLTLLMRYLQQRQQQGQQQPQFTQQSYYDPYYGTPGAAPALPDYPGQSAGPGPGYLNDTFALPTAMGYGGYGASDFYYG